MSVAASVQQSEPTSDVHAPSASGASGDDEEPLDWSLVLGGLMALLLSLPVTHWLDTRFDSIPALLSFWAVHLPTLAMAIAIGWFLLRAPRPKLEGGEVLAAVVFAPLLLILGILGNVLTCGPYGCALRDLRGEFGTPTINRVIAWRRATWDPGSLS